MKEKTIRLDELNSVKKIIREGVDVEKKFLQLNEEVLKDKLDGERVLFKLDELNLAGMMSGGLTHDKAAHRTKLYFTQNHIILFNIGPFNKPVQISKYNYNEVTSIKFTNNSGNNNSITIQINSGNYYALYINAQEKGELLNFIKSKKINIDIKQSKTYNTYAVLFGVFTSFMYITAMKHPIVLLVAAIALIYGFFGTIQNLFNFKTKEQLKHSH